MGFLWRIFMQNYLLINENILELDTKNQNNSHMMLNNITKLEPFEQRQFSVQKGQKVD